MQRPPARCKRDRKIFMRDGLAGFGPWFRERRKERRLSAAKLSRLADMSLSYVSALERGAATPKPETIERLSQALRLSAKEKNKFRELVAIDSARPEAIADRVPASPGLTIWTHLPRELAALNRNLALSIRNAPWKYEYAEDFWIESVPAIASLLSWIALHRSQPSAIEIRRVRRIVTVMKKQWDGVLGHDFDGLPTSSYIAQHLPVIWRTPLFSDAGTTALLAAEVSDWGYTEDRLTVYFKGESLARFKVEDASAASVRFVHDCLVACSLWEFASLSDAVGPLNFDGLDNPLPRAEPLTLEMALRLYEVPGLGERLLGEKSEILRRVNDDRSRHGEPSFESEVDRDGPP